MQLLLTTTDSELTFYRQRKWKWVSGSWVMGQRQWPIDHDKM